MSLLTENKAGLFAARCRKPEWVPFEKLVEADPDSTQSRWDRKLGANVFLVQCAFETTDRAAYLEHMKTVHGERTFHGHNGPWAKTIKAGAYAPRLLEEGKPWKDPSRTKDPLTQTCPSCGLVAEVDDRPGNVLWWDEHLRMCTGEAAVAS